MFVVSRSAVLLATMLWLAWGSSASGQSSGSPSSQAAEAFFSALQRARWNAAAALVDPASAADFRDQNLSMLIAWAENRERIQRVRKAGGGMVAYSSEGTVNTFLLAQFGSTVLRALPGRPTLQQLAESTPAEFVALWLEASDHGIAPDSAGPSGRPTRRILGEVLEGDSVAHVLYRPEAPGYEYTNPHHVEILQLRRLGQEWRVLLRGVGLDFIDGPIMLHMDEEDVLVDP